MNSTLQYLDNRIAKHNIFFGHGIDTNFIENKNFRILGELKKEDKK